MKTEKENILLLFYEKLYERFGPQHWWPGDSPFEVMMGAILTQNTAWKNVERVIGKLKQERIFTPEKLYSIPEKRLAEIIKPSGYFNQKAKKIKSFLEYFKKYKFDPEKLKKIPTNKLREELLAIKGIGEETADSILLYALEKPVFVIDAYTKRILSRHGLCYPGAKYRELQQIFTDNLPPDTNLFNEYHALIVMCGKLFCAKGAPLCAQCPLAELLPIAHGDTRNK